jgi:Short C-terminal domain
LMTNPDREPPDKWAAHTRESLEALWAARKAVHARLSTNALTTAADIPAGPGSGDGVSAELERLARLHTAGAIDDEEFRAAKARVLGTAPHLAISSALSIIASSFSCPAHPRSY